MMSYLAGYSNGFSNRRAQLKIQQMAFVLVALMIFLALATLFYFSISSKQLRDDAEDIREEEIKEMVRKMAGTPEFTWSVFDCSNCIDMDKVMILKEMNNYKGFWKRVVFLQVLRVYPKQEAEECIKGIYPNCNTITLVDEGMETGTVAGSAFVALCRYDNEKRINRCELGKIVMGFETLE